MPDRTPNRSIENDLEVAAPSISAIAKGGGVSLARNLLSHTVNVRPKLWDDKYPPAKIWIGRIKSYQLAQCTADAVFYYTGGYPFHFRDANWNFPPLHCMGRYGQPEVLSSREMCLEYVEYIAKSLAFRPHRFDFINQVKAVLASPAYLHQRAEFLESLNEAHGAPAAPVDQLADTANQPPPENDDANYHDWREMEVECNFMMSSEIPPSSEAKYIASFGFDFDNKLQSTWEIPYVPWNAHDKKMEEPSTSSAFADSFVPPPSEGHGFDLENSLQSTRATSHVGRNGFDERTEEPSTSSALTDIFIASVLVTEDEDLWNLEMYPPEAMATSNDFVSNILNASDQFEAEQWRFPNESDWNLISPLPHILQCSTRQ